MTKILSWNVNGIRAIIKKDAFLPFIEKEQPDILCLQETKAKKEQVENLELKNYPFHFWNSAERPGYSSVAIFSKIKPISVIKGIGHGLDNEGRVLTLEFNEYYLITVYTPNSKDDLSRIPIRHKEWDPQFLKYCKGLEKKKPVIFCGDLNVAHEEIDLKNDRANVGNAGFTYEEREGFSNFIGADLVDTFRYFYPKLEKYSWWSYRGGARLRNVGWRLDYFLVSKSLISKIQDAVILNDVMGSDHCPVGIILKK